MKAQAIFVTFMASTVCMAQSKTLAESIDNGGAPIPFGFLHGGKLQTQNARALSGMLNSLMPMKKNLFLNSLEGYGEEDTRLFKRAQDMSALSEKYFTPRTSSLDDEISRLMEDILIQYRTIINQRNQRLAGVGVPYRM
ncbi:uncharacterized protein LOC111708081 isoform X1 [Eurytemora carolleeae]|uniref:uncharacterized protein LOC111708081 isoform X1 n=1 Tax=Eurytemora carolleeae TaxID=1294199 RepID=UPI000C757256|nr:uncharacterized protein LOC111708081 isoform X1 [Eurytemora carolleeae]|eukprot:XP_023337107.1 uncharacterized protein LOC111708081 isoform X1 [Eurytemora affinis]